MNRTSKPFLPVLGNLGSARASRAVFGALAENIFHKNSIPSFRRVSRQDRKFHPLAWAGIALALCAGCKPGAATFKYETTPVARGDLVEYVAASGTLSAVTSVDVGSQVSGKISVLNADFNSPVKKGDLVAEIDPSVYRATVRQAEGDLASAQATATLKGQNLERKKLLVPQHAATQLDLDQAVAELAQA